MAREGVSRPQGRARRLLRRRGGLPLDRGAGVSCRIFDTQREQWIDLDALPSDSASSAEPPVHPKRCGPCDDCREAPG